MNQSSIMMKGAPARAIQELAGHADLATTQRLHALESTRAGSNRGGRRCWSGLRGSNPCPRLGKPLYYHCTKPAIPGGHVV